MFIACSLDGFIAGRGGDLSWLPEPDPAEDYGYGSFLAETEAILVGRATYDVASGFAAWPYEEKPVFVATSRPLEPAAATVRPVSGTPSELLEAVRAHTAGAVYLDGGALIRSFLDDGLIDELTVTIVPVVLGSGVPLFAGSARSHRLALAAASPYPSGLVQLRYAFPAQLRELVHILRWAAGRAAPAAEARRRVRAERRRDRGDGLDVLDRAGSDAELDEDPLIGAGPRREQPSAVG